MEYDGNVDGVLILTIAVTIAGGLGFQFMEWFTPFYEEYQARAEMQRLINEMVRGIAK